MIIKRLKNYITPLIVITLLSFMAAQMVTSVQKNSATADEPIHLLSGYATLTQHHIIFDPEHPFLIKAIAALPLLWLQTEIPNDARNLTPSQKNIDHNSYYDANQWGWEMLFNGQSDGYQMLFSARLMMIALTLFLGVIIFFWGKQVFGTIPAILALTLYTFDPNVIAHGQLINTDIGASLFFIGTIAGFWNFITKRSRNWLIITGIALGLGMISKFSLGMLAIILPLLTIIWLVIHRHRLDEIDPAFPRKIDHWQLLSPKIKVWLKYTIPIASIGIIALSIIWLAYGLLMVINPTDNPWQRPAIQEPGNTMLSILPPAYAKGIANIVAPERQGYLLGQCFAGSRWDYFPILSLFKTPLATLIAIVFSLGAYIFIRHRGRLIPAFQRFPFIYFIVPITVYWLISGVTGINIGIRHILPIYILCVITTGYAFQVLWHQKQIHWRSMQLSRLFALLLVVGVAIASLLAWPNYLSYYNELAQEPQDRPYIADDSNTDWGQATKALAEYVRENNIKSIAFDNFISRAEADYLKLPYTSADPSNHDYKGYIAISRSTITNHICQHNNDWGWLIDNQKPVTIINGAINVYQIK